MADDARAMDEPTESGARCGVFLRAFHAAVASCAVPPTAQEFVRAFPGLAPTHHEALYELHRDVLSAWAKRSREEFETICEEEEIAQRLNAIDAMCARAGMGDLDVASNAARVAYGGKTPDEVARNTRAAAKKMEAAALREIADGLEASARAKIGELETKRAAVRSAANGLKSSESGGEKIFEASMQWSARAPQALRS